MVLGSNGNPKNPGLVREIKGIKSSVPNFDTVRETPKNLHQTTKSSISTGVSSRTLAYEEKIGQTLHAEAVKAEMRSKLLARLGRKNQKLV